MAISLRLQKDEELLLREYVAANNLTLSKFIRNVLMDKIEDELALDEKKILKVLKESKKEKRVSHEDLLKNLGF